MFVKGKEKLLMVLFGNMLKYAAMGEWFKPVVLKTTEVKASPGSNPGRRANRVIRLPLWLLLGLVN